MRSSWTSFVRHLEAISIFWTSQKKIWKSFDRASRLRFSSKIDDFYRCMCIFIYVYVYVYVNLYLPGNDFLKLEVQCKLDEEINLILSGANKLSYYGFDSYTNSHRYQHFKKPF